jgi:peptidoglycan/LPS O-acetylase OafA/YrhL
VPETIPLQPSERQATRGFRHDINALRAIAAMSVVLFHFGVAGFGGGFVGVDIFLVISGLLMTQIVDRGVASGRFSILGFYAARARRIVPALLVLCAVLLLIALLVLDPMTAREVSQDAIASLLFWSNMLYATQSGYFAQGAETNWLLHTWTLSVEWQFYLAYPVLLALASRWRWLWSRRAAATGIACLLALAVTCWVSARSISYQQYAFFLLPTRAWEMLAGGWLAFAAPRIARRHVAVLLTVAGFAALAVAIFLFDGAMPWPSIWVAVPVVGTTAILAAGLGDARWTKLPALQPLGTWSYSIYLWHWPLVVALSYSETPRTAPVLAASVAASVLLGYLSYRFAETGLRRAVFGDGTGTRRQWLAFGALFAAVTIVALAGWRTNGLERVRTATMPPATRAALTDYREAFGDWQGLGRCPKLAPFSAGHVCTIGKGHHLRVAIIGDSHAEQMLPRFNALARTHDVEITLFSKGGCPPLPDSLWASSGVGCRMLTDKVFRTIERGHYARVMVLAAWALYFDRQENGIPPGFCQMTWRGCRTLTDRANAGVLVARSFTALADRMRRLREGGARVTLVVPDATPGHITPRDYYRRTFQSGTAIVAPPVDRAEFVRRTGGIRTLLAETAREAGVDLLDPIRTRCGPTSCPVYEDGHYIYKDTHHLRASLVTRPAFGYLDAALVGR